MCPRYGQAGVHTFFKLISDQGSRITREPGSYGYMPSHEPVIQTEADEANEEHSEVVSEFDESSQEASTDTKSCIARPEVVRLYGTFTTDAECRRH